MRPSHLRRTRWWAARSPRTSATRRGRSPGAHVAVRWGDKRWEGTTDEEGFLELWVPPPEGVAPGWNQVEVELLSPEPEGVAASRRRCWWRALAPGSG